jgi:hypothetical protein
MGSGPRRRDRLERSNRQADGLPSRRAVRLYGVPEKAACMTRGKKIECPRIVVVQVAELKFETVDEAWAVVGPVLARVIAAAILREEQRGPCASRSTAASCNGHPSPQMKE